MEEFQATVVGGSERAITGAFDEISESLATKCTTAVLNAAGIEGRPPVFQLEDWIQPRTLALGLFVSGHSLDGLLFRSGAISSGEPELTSVVEQVRENAPRALAALSTQLRRATIWSIADVLEDTLGPGFFCNYACRAEVQDVLLNHAEGITDYATRALQLLWDHPELLAGKTSFNASMRACGLNDLLAIRADLREKALMAFQRAVIRSPV